MPNSPDYAPRTLRCVPALADSLKKKPSCVTGWKRVLVQAHPVATPRYLVIILEKHPVSGYEPRHYRREPSGSVGVGVDSRRTSADPLPVYLSIKRPGLGPRGTTVEWPA